MSHVYNLFIITSTYPGWTVRACAFIVLGCYAIATVTIKSRRPPKPLPPLLRIVDFSAFLDARYAIFAVGAWFNIVSVFNPFFQVGAYGTVANGASSLTPYLLAIMCATSIAGRVLPGIIADKIGRYAWPSSRMLPDDTHAEVAGSTQYRPRRLCLAS